MSDSEITTAASTTETHQTTQPSSMEDDQTHHPPQDSQNDLQQNPNKLNNSNLSFRIWPPSQRTRDAVISRLIETLTTPSVLSKRYGALPADDASSVARSIEQEAFSVAEGASSAEDDGIEILQVYSKEISKRMLDAVKTRANAATVEVNDNGVGAAAAATEDAVSTAEPEA